MPKFRNTLVHLHRRAPTYSPMKMEQTECSETSAYKIQTPENYPEESIQHSEHGECLKSRRYTYNISQCWWVSSKQLIKSVGFKNLYRQFVSHLVGAQVGWVYLGFITVEGTNGWPTSRTEDKLHKKLTSVKEVGGDDVELFSIVLEVSCERKSNLTAIMVMLGFSER